MPIDGMQLAQRFLPQPTRVAALDGAFRFDAETALSCESGLDAVAQWLRETLQKSMTLPLRATRAATHNAITLRLSDDLPIGGEEAYTLRVNPQTIQITARRQAGLIWGIQTLHQLLPIETFAAAANAVACTSPCCVIEDAPAFAWRGLMLDCARHFMPLEFIYKWIDLLSLHKLNVFHWHLTDDQGWRIEIKKYPRLTEIGAWRVQTLVGHALPKREYDTFDGEPHGGFYTQDQIRAVVRYATQRGVTIVPEIEMPGHTQAAIAAYPELGNLNRSLDVWTIWGINPNIVNVEDATICFFKDVIDEVIELFPSQFIHVGGDEAVKDQWRTSAAAQRKMRDLHLHNEDQLQSWFMSQINDHLRARGRRMIGWDEILDGGLVPDAAVMSWRGEAGGVAAARAGHAAVMSPAQIVYLDHYQTADRAGEPLAIGGCSTLRDVYEYRAVPAELELSARKHVLGAQANLWTEYVRTPSHAEYMAFPRACALAEVLWSDQQRDWANFQQRLDCHLHRLDSLRVNYRR